MAVINTIEKSTLQIQVDNGVNAAGQAVSKSYSINNANPEASADVLYKTGKALGGLVDHEVQAVYVTEKHQLVEQA